MSFKYLVEKHLGKYMMVQMFQDGILTFKSFVAQWVIQMKEDMHKLGQ